MGEFAAGQPVGTAGKAKASVTQTVLAQPSDPEDHLAGCGARLVRPWLCRPGRVWMVGQ